MGAHPNEQRRGLARRLRAAGHTLQEIGRQMGISHQAAGHLIGGALIQTPIRCRKCKVTICTGMRGMDNMKKRPVCLACLAKMPDAGYGERLRALRLSRGMTREQLAEATGVMLAAIGEHERMKVGTPRWDALVRLARFLGPVLVGIDDARQA